MSFSKNQALAAKLIALAVLTVPFVYEKNDKGDLKLRAVIYDLDVVNNGETGKKDINVTIGGIFKEQVKAVKKIVADISASRKSKKEDADIDADFADIVFSEDDEAEFDAELAAE